MRVACILHSDAEAPSSLKRWVKDRNYDLICLNFIQGWHVPPVDGVDLVIVFGGAYSTSSPQISSQLALEISFLKKAILLNKPVLGVCFGMQVLGEIFKIPIELSLDKEIGLGEVSLNNAAVLDPFTYRVPKQFEAFHCHTEMLGLAEGLKILAKTDQCARQLACFKPLVYGMQFHLEVDLKLAKIMLGNFPETRDVIKALSGFDFLTMHKIFYQFLDNLVYLIHYRTKGHVYYPFDQFYSTMIS